MSNAISPPSRPGSNSGRLWRELDTCPPDVHRSVVRVHGNELQLHVEQLRRRRRKLLAHLYESDQLRGRMPGLVQHRLHPQLDLHGDRRRERQRLLQWRLHMPHHVHGPVFRQLFQRDL